MLRNKTAIASIAAAVTAAVAPLAHSATLSQSYYTVQISTVGTFATSTTLTVSAANPTVSVPAGDFLRFGISDVVTNNPDPYQNNAFDQANQGNGNNALPATLGLASIGYTITSSDVAGTVLPAVVGGSGSSASTATFYGGNSVTFASKTTGDVIGGNVGTAFSVFAGNGTQDLTTSGGLANVGFDNGSTPYTFQRLSYHSIGTANATVTITPTMRVDQTQYYTLADGGSINPTTGNPVSPTTQTNLFGLGDTVNALPALTVNIIGTPTPTPTATTVISLAATAPTPANQTTNRGTITVTQGQGGAVGTSNTLDFTSMTTPVGTNNFTGIQSGFVTANGFLAGQTEAYGFSLLDNGGTPTTAALNDLVTFLNGNASGGTAVLRTGALTPAQAFVFRGLPAADQIAFITTGTPGASPEFLGFDVSGFTADGTFTITSLTAVPEPASIAGLALGVGGLLASRRKRVA